MESTLSLKKSHYEQGVGAYFGYGRGDDAGEDAWDSRKTRRIEDCVESGLRRFYHCGYKWSFLRPFITLSLPENGDSVVLPDDVGGIEGVVYVSSESGSVFVPLATRNPGQIEMMHSQHPDLAGSPRFASLRPLKGTTASRGQQQDIYLFPSADQAYTVKVQCYIRPNLLDGTHAYAWGGAEHSETILESCLAIAEERYDHISGGPHAVAYERMMRASVDMDQRKKPQAHGYNRDLSDGASFRVSRRGQDLGTVTVNGVDHST